MVHIVINVFNKGYTEPALTSYANKETLELARDWVQSQEEHYIRQGCRITWKIFENGTCVDKGLTLTI